MEVALTMFGYGYVLGAAGLVILVAAGWGTLESYRRESVQQKLEAVEASRQAIVEDRDRLVSVVEAQNRNIDKMLRQAAEDQRLTTALTVERQRLAAERDDAIARRKEIEETDATAADFLGLLIPDGLLPLVNRTAPHRR